MTENRIICHCSEKPVTLYQKQGSIWVCGQCGCAFAHGICSCPDVLGAPHFHHVFNAPCAKAFRDSIPALSAEFQRTYRRERGIPVVVERPTIVCLCGSTRFGMAFREANLRQTLAGRIVLTIGCDWRDDSDLFSAHSPEELAEIKNRLDELHLRKIDLADEVLVLNVGGYIGDSTRREIEYAHRLGKRIQFLEEIDADP